MKDVYIGLRVSKKTQAELKRRAKLLKCTVSSLLRTLIVQQLEKEIRQ